MGRVVVYGSCLCKGTVFCSTCRNVIAVTEEQKACLELPLVSRDCDDRSLFLFHTNETFYETADQLELAHARGPTVLKRLQQHCGMNYNPHGLLFDKDLRERQILKPIDNQIRDWMHTLVSGGVANTHIGLLLHVLDANGVSVDQVGDYSMNFTLPKKYGKVQRSWISDHRLKDATLSSFASTMLCIVPILLCFMQEVLGPPRLAEHTLLLKLLCNIIDILCLGADRSMAHVERLITLIDLYAKLFTKMFPGAAKPKFHQLFHVPDGMRWLGRLLSCFVTERKHRQSKRAALHVFRHMEHTVLSDMVNSMCESMTNEAGNLFTKSCLIGDSGFSRNGPLSLRQSNTALLECGIVKHEDIVYIDSGVVGRVSSFWQTEGADWFYVQVAILAPIDEGGIRYYAAESLINYFVEASAIIDACIWIPKRNGVLKVLLPFAARVAE